MNTVMVSFNTIMGQMTEMFPWPICLHKKWPKCLSDKKTQGTKHNFGWNTQYADL